METEIEKSLDDFTDIVNNKEDYRYVMMCDNASRVVISLTQSYYSIYSSTEYECTRHCVELSEFALRIARGAKAKSNAEKALEEIRLILEKLPHKEVFANICDIRGCIKSSRKKSHTEKVSAEAEEIIEENISDAIKIVEYCAPRIVSLKEYLDTKDELYIKISTEIVECALSIVIDVFNRELKAFDVLIKKNAEDSAGFNNIYATDIQRKGHTISKMLGDCCHLFADLDLFDMDSQYNTQRYTKNKTTILCQAREFGLDPSSFHPSIDLRRDEEHFMGCLSCKDYEMYLKCHPKGKYTKEANCRLQRLKKEEAYKDAYWLECEKHKAYDAYLVKYPHGRYAKNAQMKEKELSEMRQGRFAMLFIFIIVIFVITIVLFGVNTKGETSKPSIPKTNTSIPVQDYEKNSNTHIENNKDEFTDPDRFGDVEENDEEENDADVEDEFDNNNDYE